jgi:hypothetical protein
MTTRAVPAPSHLRTYIAGTGATGALLGGALIAFLSVAAFVSFNGIPIGGKGSNSDSVVLQSGGAPAAAAAAAAPTAGAVAPAPVAGAVPFTAGGFGGAGGARAPGVNRSGPSGRSGHGNGHGGGGLGPGGGRGNGSGPTTNLPGKAPQGVLSNTAHGVDSAAGRLGVHTNLGGATDRITKPADNAATGTLNRVGGAIGKPHLGDNASRRANDVTHRIFGGGKP